MDRDTAESIAGVYDFLRNILLVLLVDLIDHGADQSRIDKLLSRLDEANGQLPEGPSREMADSATSAVHALLGALRK